MVLKGLIVVALSTGVRLAGALGMLALLGRGLGPEGLSQFLYLYTVGVLIGTLSDYGFASQALRECSRPGDISGTAKSIFGAKLLATLIVSIGAVLYVHVSNGFAWDPSSVAILVAGGLASLTDFCGILLKARGLFAFELLGTLVSALLCNVLVGVVGYTTNDIWLAAIVLLAGRIFGFVLFLCVLRWKAAIHIGFGMIEHARGLVRQLREGFAYAVDSISSQLFYAIDVLFANHVLGRIESGIYIASTRLSQAALSGHGVISSVFMPSLTVDKKGWQSFGLRGKMTLFVLATWGGGAMVWACFSYFAQTLPIVFLGSEFAAMSVLMPYLGFFVFARYINVIPSVWMLVFGYKLQKAIIGFLTLLATAAFLFFFRPGSALDLLKSMCCFALLNSLVLYCFVVITRRTSPA